jgi:hypothetical protein
VYLTSSRPGGACQPVAARTVYPPDARCPVWDLPMGEKPMNPLSRYSELVLPQFVLVWLKLCGRSPVIGGRFADRRG